MCRFASFLHNPFTGEVVVFDLESHGNTEKELKLNPKIWREGHYLPTGEFELRLTSEDKIDKAEYETAFRNRFPNFISFLNWSLERLVKDGVYSGLLSLDGLTSAEGLVLPQSVGGSLSLDGLTSAEGLVLPQSVGGSLSLNGLTSAEGLVLPQSVGGSLSLDGLTSAEGLVLPQSVGGLLSLNGLTLEEKEIIYKKLNK